MTKEELIQKGRQEVIDILWYYWHGGTMDDVISILGGMRDGGFDYKEWKEEHDESNN